MKPAQRGRPTSHAEVGKKHTVSLRLTGDLKNRLDASAKRNDRSLSQEGELRLEQSFRDEGHLNEILSHRYGRQLAGILRMIGDTVVEVGPQVAFDETKSFDETRNWPANPAAMAAAKHAIAHIFDVIAPNAANVDEKAVSDRGRGFAKSIIQSVMGRGGNEYTKEDEAEIKALLGPLAKNLKVN